MADDSGLSRQLPFSAPRLRARRRAFSTSQLCRTLLGLLLVHWASLSSRASAACIVRLDIDAGSSPLILTNKNEIFPVGDESNPLGSAGTFDPQSPRGLSGVLYAVHPTLSTCPASSDRTAWFANWPSFTLTSDSPSTPYNQPVDVYPAIHMGRTEIAEPDTHDYNVTDLKVAINLSDITPVAGQPGSFTSRWATQLADGWLTSDNVVTSARRDSVQNFTASATAVPMQLDVQNVGGANTLVLKAPTVQLLYRVIGTIDVFGTMYNSFANFTLAVNLTAKAVLDCPSYCGDFGRCANSSCVCDCGWASAGGQCTVPYGYCSALPGQQAAPVPPPLSPSPPHSPALVCPTTNTSTNSVSPVNGACPTGYDWDQFGVLCNACPAGFSGTQCALCGSDAACQRSLGSSTGTCFVSPVYKPRSREKHYTCILQERSVAQVVGTTLDFTCSTVKPGSSNLTASDLTVGAGMMAPNTPVGNSPYCAMAFRLAGMPRDAAVECTGWDCRFAVNTSRVTCPVVKCVCPKGCSNAAGTITEATFTKLNSDVSILCGSDADQSDTGPDGVTGCAISLSGLPLPPLAATCRATECLDPVNGTITVTEEASYETQNEALLPVISWIPFMFLLAAVLAGTAAAVAFLFAAGPARRPATSWHLGPPIASASAPASAAGPNGQPDSGVSAPTAPGSGSGSSTALASGAALGPVAEAVLDDGTAMVRPDPAAAAVPPAATAAIAPGGVVETGGLPPPPGGEWSAGQMSGQTRGPGSREGPSSTTNSTTNSSRGEGGTSGRGVAEGPGVLRQSARGKATAAAVAAVPAVALEPSSPGGPYVWGGSVEGVGGSPLSSAPGAERGCVRELSWHHLDLSTHPRRPLLRPWKRHPATTLLQDVSGRAMSGEILGILGPSGSGKTTLLSVLAGLIQPGYHWRLTGRIALDGRTVAAPRHLAALVGHVPQHDLLARSMTVEECVAANAALRLSRAELQRGRGHVQARVDAVLRELHISYLAHRIVWPGGGAPISVAGGTLSGGERLRVAAALELVSDPPLLLLDEPLSGLDSTTARTTMAALRAVAGGSGGRVVVMSLHQPSPGLFASLDSVMLMAGGRVALAVTPATTAPVLAAAGAPPPPLGIPLPDHLLDLVVTDPKVTGKMCAWTAATAATAVGGCGSAASATDSVSAADLDYVRALVSERNGGGGFGAAARRLWLELGMLTWRSGLDMLRNPSMALLHCIVIAVIGLLVGAVFSNTQVDISGAQNRVGSLFFSIMLLTCFASSAVDAIYPERPIVDRDLLRRSYGILPYVTSKLMLDGLLLRAVPAWAFGLPFYWLMGLRSQASAFFIFLGAFTTMSCLSGAACITLSFIVSSPGRAVLVLNLLLLAAALFAGFLANADSIVVWLRWIVYLSPVRYCWQVVVVNELDPLVLNFSNPDLPQGLPDVKGSLFLSLLGVEPAWLQTNLIVLGCIYAIVAIAAVTCAALRVVALRGRWT